MKYRRVLLPVATVLAAMASPLHAQISITPMLGGYIPASDIHQVSGNAQNIAKTREGTLSLGANIDFGMLRASGAYASGTTIKNANKQDIGKGSVGALAADLVIRPLPRILVQPYLLAGAGEKFYHYDQSTTLLSGGNTNNFAFHGGLGADMMLGSVGVAAELTDFLSKGVDDKWNVHDAFLMVGLKLRLGSK
ncbi:MAG TPA: hypothetical protein VK636_16045 [Gemmatimonadaceae bacterium]|nr:hypothetical protein [Gemmatimonadaceae bacterium]